MTLLHVYNLYDNTTETYIAQFFCSHDKLMKRQCSDMYEQAKQVHAQNSLNPQGAIFRYADEYMMIHTADFDDQTGIYTMLPQPVPICNFGIFSKKEKEVNSVMTDDEAFYKKQIDIKTSANNKSPNDLG